MAIRPLSTNTMPASGFCMPASALQTKRIQEQTQQQTRGQALWRLSLGPLLNHFGRLQDVERTNKKSNMTNVTDLVFTRLYHPFMVLLTSRVSWKLRLCSGGVTCFRGWARSRQLFQVHASPQDRHHATTDRVAMAADLDEARISHLFSSPETFTPRRRATSPGITRDDRGRVLL